MCASQETIDILLVAGWHPGRKIDTKQIEEYLISSGYEVFTSVKAFLEEFGMLELNVQNKRAIMSGIGSNDSKHHTNPEKAIKGYFIAGSFEHIIKQECFKGWGIKKVGIYSPLVSSISVVFCSTPEV